MLLENKQFLAAALVLLFVQHTYAGSCLQHGIDVCCTADHCPTQISPDGCYCDENCAQFGDCCDDIDLICTNYEDSCNDTSIRLADGGSDLQGRVEVCVNGEWGTVCDYGWSSIDARVVCAQLNHPYSGAQGLKSARFLEGLGSIHMTRVNCSGDESNLFECSFTNETSFCNHGMDASVVCGDSQCTDGEVRLVDGTRTTEGRVEVCHNGIWGTVCDNSWDRNDATVVCRQLGLSTGRVIAKSGGYFGNAQGPINMNNVGCTGTEGSIFDCSFNENSHCTHNDDAGVICGYQQGCIDGLIRLVDGTNSSEGRVEVCVKGAWNTICDEGWDEYAARVICREIGYEFAGAVALSGGFFKSGSELTDVYLANVTCTGHEKSILHCGYITPTISVCPHSKDAGVRCLPGPGHCINNDIRLVDGPDGSQGRVEVCLFERWGTVCDSRWSTPHAEVVCRQLGLPVTGATALSGAYYGIGSGPINMDNIICTGSESNLTSCMFTSNEQFCTHSNDAGVRCPCVHGDIRLVGTPTPSAGRVEVCYFGSWGTVTDDGWNNVDSNVVCRQLGYWGNVSYALSFAFFGAGTGPIHLDFVRCDGDEDELLDCNFSPPSNTDSHNEDAGAICFDGTPRGSCLDGSIRLVDGLSSMEGRVEACIVGQWGTVCHDGWGYNDAAVVCDQLGYPRVGTAYRGLSFLPGRGRIYLRNTACDSTHQSLLECPYTLPFSPSCSHLTDAGVKCYESNNCTHGDMRLVNGPFPNEGRVEVCFRGVWGSVTSSFFGDDEAKVVCTQLGYFEYLAVPRLNAYYGAGSDPIVLDGLRCRGDERSLVDCPSREVLIQSDHSFDAGVYCYSNNTSNGICSIGDIRLSDGSTDREGRLEVCLDGVWSSVCADGLSTDIANVICRQLGHVGYGSIALPGSYFMNANTNQSMSITGIACVGHEDSVWDCETTATPNICTSGLEASVKCLDKVCTDGEVRLVDGSDSLEGRVEVCIDGVWGTLCDDGWRKENSIVICKQLGHSDQFALGYNSAYFGAGVSVPILMDNVACTGNESRLTDCPYDPHTADCSHNEDVGIKCYPLEGFTGSGGECEHGAIRLVNGSVPHEGRVELCIDEHWGTVCDDRFTFADGVVVCRQLGYSDLGSTVFTDGRYGPGSEDLPIYIDNAACAGNEEMLLDCLYDPHTADCSHQRDVGVKCVLTGQCEDGSIRLVNGSRVTEGRVEVCSGGVWGTIAGVSTRFDNNAAKVACRQLGYSDEYVLPMGPSFGAGQGPVHGYAIQCEGDEPHVLNCTHLKIPLNVINPHVADIGIRCFNLTDAPCTPGDVRLVNGSVNTSSSVDGRVEVCLDGEWGTLCGDYWIEDDSRVVCAQLGYSKYAALTLPPAYYGLGNVSTDEVSVHFVPICQGNENNIMDCELYYVDSCTHYSDTALRCYKGDSCTEGDVRLVSQDGSSGNEGRVEVCQHGIWGTVCEDLFSKTDARVVCRELGYTDTYAVSFVGAYYGKGDGPIHLDNVQCVGNEDSLLECIYDDVTDDCTHDQDVGVACYNESQCDHGAVRLVDGNYSYEGRVEYCLNGIWGTICETYWDYYDAVTVCKQLGLVHEYAVGYTGAYYGEGQSEIVLSGVDCLNQQPNINQCFRTQNVDGCTHRNDVGVACYPDRLCSIEGDVRLLDGPTPSEGRVEVCLNGVWGSISSNQWDVNDAIVVCGQLGYIATDAIAVGGARYGETNGRINMHQVQCTGAEDSLLDCNYITFTVFRDHDEDAGVKCYEEVNCTTGDVRLMGGDTPMAGRVEVCIDSSWTTVNSNRWTYTESRVVCGQLGYSSKVAFRDSGFGTANGPVGITNVQCTGSEGFLLNCTFSTNTQSLDHGDDVGIQCFNDTSDSNSTCINGAVRLFGGDTMYEGTVEICLNGVWGSICYFGWDSNDASVICNQLGYAAHDNPEVFAAFFGQSPGPILLDNINCEGTESSIAECNVDPSPRGACTHFHDAGVRCLKKACVEDSIRLVGGSKPSEGRVEICIRGIWSTVCDNAWDTPDARVACRQAGYSDTVGIAYTHGIFGHGTGPIAVWNTQCTGTESTLSACDFNTNTDTCSHGNDAGVKCYNTSTDDLCALGDVRLVGGAGSYEGSVEVCLDNEWGTVCDDEWTNLDSGIACRQLGYSFASTVFKRGFFTSNSSAIHLDDLLCSGAESKLVHCPFDYHAVDCTHDKDAGVKCYERTNCTEGDVRLAGGPGVYEGRLEICFDGVWGTVHGSLDPFFQWSEFETRVICTQLGLNRTGSFPGTGDYGISSGPVIFSEFICQGFEQNIAECNFNAITVGLTHTQDVGVKCQPPPPLCYDGDLRLVDGSVPQWGRIEVCFNETWGTITDDLWSYNDGLVACRQLGYSDQVAVIRSNAFFGQGTGPIYMDNIRCSGFETRLVDCLHNTNTERDTHSEDAGLQCFMIDDCTHGDIKLVNGSTPSEGIVATCVQGTWSTIRDSAWSTTNAKIACGQLGYSRKYAVAVQGNDIHRENTAYLPILINAYYCTGNEERLNDCYSLSFPDLEHNFVAGVECYSEGQVGNCSLGEIRLVDGVNSTEGRVEMCVGGEWGTVCNEDWTAVEARVVCRQLGYTDTASQVTAGGAFGEGVGKILFRSVECYGDEANLLECEHDSLLGLCTHSSDAGVICHPGDGCINGDVRLIGNTSYSGRVEVCVNGVWGTVCHDYWGTEDARVVCRQLGLPSKHPVAFREAFFGAGNIPIVLDNIICTGTESNLTQCDYDFDTSDCTHAHDVGVACLDEAQCVNGSVRLVNGDLLNPSSGRVDVCVDGVWGSVCDNGFSINEARVVCKSINMTTDYAIPYGGGYYGVGNGPIFYEVVDCDGDESTLTQCSVGYEVDCLHSQDVGVACLAEPECDVEGEIRLVNNGTYSNEGRLEVCLHGVWGTVTDTFLDTYTIRTLCEIMGFESGGHRVDIQRYGVGIGPIHLDNIFCLGSETSILDCRYSVFTLFNGHSEDIALLCYKSDNCTEGDVRLVNGTTSKEGRVELCLSNTFGTIADNLYSPSARVICSQLGYSDRFAMPYSSQRFGQGVGPISISSLYCDGNEKNVLECSYYTSFFLLDHFYDAGIQCFDDNDLNSTDSCQLGETRLVGGNSSSEGRVEVCINGQWSTLCVNFLTQTIANTVCSTQDFASSGATALYATGYGPSNSSILLRDVYCNGQESNVLECEFRGDTMGCTHDQDLAVSCLEKECNHGDVRLADGSTSAEGRVEVCMGGRWGTVCDDDWDQYDALVICRQLGYNSSYALPYHYDHFTGSDVPIALDGLHCDGDEASWSDCLYTNQYIQFCSQEENSGLRCFNNVTTDICKTGDHRLVDGRGTYEGRVEVCVGGEWSSVCRDGGWDTENAQVACRAAYGETDVALTYFSGYFGNGTGPIYVSRVSCSGFESSLLSCDHTASTLYCDHSQDIGVRCTRGDDCSVEGEVRLVGGSGPHEGRLEICVNGVWGTYAVPSFPFESAVTVCSQLGYSTLYADTFSSSEYGAGKGVIHFTYAYCRLPNAKLIDCSSSSFYSSYANHLNDVGIKCYNESAAGVCTPGSIQLVNGSSPYEGRVELCLDDQWGTLALSFWSVESARVACYQAGFAGPGAQALDVPSGTGLIQYTDVSCSGHYYSLFSCYIGNSSANTHEQDVGVKCLPSDNCTEGDVRLSGDRPESGFVEVCQQSAWSTISEPYLSQYDADIICQSIGYPFADSYFFRGLTGPPTTLPVGLTFFYCSSRSNSFLDCSKFYSSRPANHADDIGVTCYQEPSATTSNIIAPPTMTSSGLTTPTITRPVPSITRLTQQSSSTTTSVKAPPTTTSSIRALPSVTNGQDGYTSSITRSTPIMKKSSEISKVSESTVTKLRPSEVSQSTTTRPRPSESVKDSITSTILSTTQSITILRPSSAEQNTLSMDISGDFDSTTFPRDDFKRSVAESANQYCESSTDCRRKRSLNTRQDAGRVTADDVVIVEVTDVEGGGVSVSFYVMGSDRDTVIEADTLYEAVKMGIDEGVFEKAGFDSVSVEPPPTAPSAANRGGMAAGTQAGIAVTVIIVVLLVVSGVVILLLIVWLKRKNRHFDSDKDHILTNRDSFISNKDSMIEIDTKPSLEDQAYVTVSSGQSDSSPANEKLQFKDDEGAITDKDVMADPSPASKTDDTTF